MSKTKGVVRRVDNLGRIVLPAEMRRTLGIKEGDAVDMSLSGKSIVLVRNGNVDASRLLKEALDAIVATGKDADLVDAIAPKIGILTMREKARKRS